MNNFGELEIQSGAHGGVTLDGVDVTNDSLVQIDDDATLVLSDSAQIVDDFDTGGALTIGTGATLDVESDSGSLGSSLADITVTNNGTIKVGQTTSAAHLTLFEDASITGGILTIGSTATVEASGDIFGNPTLEDVTVNNSGILQVDAGTTLVIGGTVTLNGSGTILLPQPGVEQSSPTISGFDSGGSSPTIFVGTLDNVGNTFEGTGGIGAQDRSLTFDNESGGTVNANIAGSGISIDTGNVVTNAGSLEATGEATLFIDDAVSNNANGGINAGTSAGETGTVQIENTVTNAINAAVNAYAGSTVELDSATIVGGKVMTAAASGGLGAGEVVGDGSSAIDNVTVTNNGIFEANGGLVAFGSTATVSGAGFVEITSGGEAEFFGAFNQDVTFSGVGTLALSQTPYGGTVTGSTRAAIPATLSI